MSIERSCAPASQKAVGGTDGQHGKTKGPAPSDSDASASGGFQSLLSAIETDTSADSGAGTPALASADVPVALTQADPAPPLDLTLPATSAQAPVGPSDMAMLLASQTMAAAGAAVVDVPRPVATAETAAANGVTRAVPGGIQRGSGVSLGNGPDGQPGTSQALQLSQLQDAKNTQQNINELTAKSAKASAAGSAKSSLSDAQSGLSATPPDWRDLKPVYVADTAAMGAARSEIMVAPAGSDGGFRQTERSTEKALAKQVGGVTDGAWGSQALFSATRVDAPSATVNAALPSPETVVAEQVSYWITNDVQNAELKLDGFGPDPVEVSISLQGNEAHVAFRTDQAATRDVLENAVPHLKELLKNEGLVLSGVSVGTSGQQDGQGSQERRPRSGMRQMSVAAPEAVTTQGVGRNSGRAVDLFV